MKLTKAEVKILKKDLKDIQNNLLPGSWYDYVTWLDLEWRKDRGDDRWEGKSADCLRKTCAKYNIPTPKGIKTRSKVNKQIKKVSNKVIPNKTVTKTKLKKVAVIPDVHVPFHDKKAVELVLKVLKDIEVDQIVFLGDVADFYALSNFSKDPKRALNLKYEIDQTNEVLDSFGKITKDVVFIAGNHEVRLVRYIHDKCPELHEMMSIEDMFKIKERGWTYVPYKKDIKLGKVYLTHDVSFYGVNSARQNLQMYNRNIITGHTHRFTSLVEGNVRGSKHFSAQLGWLGDAEQVDYSFRVKVAKEWAHGFGVLYINPEDDYSYLQPVLLVDNTCVVNGKLYKL